MRCEIHGDLRIRPRSKRDRRKDQPEHKVVLDSFYGNEWCPVALVHDVEEARLMIGRMKHIRRKQRG